MLVGAGVHGNHFHVDVACLARRQVADEPGYGASRKVVPPAVAGADELEARWNLIVDRAVGGRSAAGLPNGRWVTPPPIEIAQVRTGNLQVKSWNLHIYEGGIMGVEVALGRRHGINLLLARRLGDAN